MVGLLSRWHGKYGKAFPFTSITINKGFGGAPGSSELHRDAGNTGPSLLRALKGRGKLRYYPGDDGGDLQKLSQYDALTLDPSRDWALMDGRKGHAEIHERRETTLALRHAAGIGRAELAHASESQCKDKCSFRENRQGGQHFRTCALMVVPVLT